MDVAEEKNVWISLIRLLTCGLDKQEKTERNKIKRSKTFAPYCLCVHVHTVSTSVYMNILYVCVCVLVDELLQRFFSLFQLWQTGLAYLLPDTC